MASTPLTTVLNLPLEIVNMIFDYLLTWDAKSFYNARLVCKAWAMCSTQEFYRTAVLRENIVHEQGRENETHFSIFSIRRTRLLEDAPFEYLRAVFEVSNDRPENPDSLVNRCDRLCNILLRSQARREALRRLIFSMKFPTSRGPVLIAAVSLLETVKSYLYDLVLDISGYNREKDIVLPTLSVVERLEVQGTTLYGLQFLGNLCRCDNLTKLVLHNVILPEIQDYSVKFTLRYLELFYIRYVNYSDKQAEDFSHNRLWSYFAASSDTLVHLAFDLMTVQYRLLTFVQFIALFTKLKSLNSDASSAPFKCDPSEMEAISHSHFHLNDLQRLEIIGRRPTEDGVILRLDATGLVPNYISSGLETTLRLLFPTIMVAYHLTSLKIHNLLVDNRTLDRNQRPLVNLRTLCLTQNFTNRYSDFDAVMALLAPNPNLQYLQFSTYVFCDFQESVRFLKEFHAVHTNIRFNRFREIEPVLTEVGYERIETLELHIDAPDSDFYTPAGSSGNRMIHLILKWYRTDGPVNALRTFNFFLKMGWFPILQYLTVDQLKILREDGSSPGQVKEQRRLLELQIMEGYCKEDGIKLIKQARSRRSNCFST